VRGYLAGETAFPDDALAVTATVATDFLSQNTWFVPSRVTDLTGQFLPISQVVRV
jgi:hypothetical protein